MTNFIDQLAAVSGSILRGNRFKMKILFPPIIAAIAETEQSEYFCISTDIPAKTLGVIEVPVYGGNKLKYPGDTVVPDWSCQLFIGPDTKIYRAIHRWAEFCNSVQLGIRANDLSLFGGAEVSLLDGLNQTAQKWVMVKIFPNDPGTLSLNKGDNDSYMTLDVSWTINDIMTNLV